MSEISDERLALIVGRSSQALTDMKDRRPIPYEGWIVKFEAMTDDISNMAAEIRRQRKLIEGLTPLARLGATALDASNEGGDYDGADIYENSVKYGAVVTVKFDPSKHTDQNGEAEAGDGWGEYPPSVLAAKRALEG